MDDLTYSYDMGNSSNRLMQVSDAGSKDYGFKDGATSSTEFGYDVNGNMIKDLNKGIGSIAYNHLNLPEAVNVTSNKGDGTGTISYIYDATGVKLKKTAPGNMVTEYTGNYVYKKVNNTTTLEFINHAEGYVENENNAYKYVYQYKDHLGNIRVSYDNSGSVSSPNASIVEENNYYPFGLRHKGYNNVVNGTENNYQTFQRQEEEKELGKNTYAFQWRDYDPAIARFNKIDRFAEKYASHSPYAFTKNNPIRYREMAGDSIWVTSNTVDDKTHFTIHFRGKVLNTSDKDINVKKYASQLQSRLSKAFTNKSGSFTFSADVEVTGVSSIDDVDSSDHLLAIVDNVEGESADGSPAGGLGEFNGQIAYVESGQWWQDTASNEWMVQTGVHEWGHNFGLRHNWTDQFSDDDAATNYMSYGNNRSGSFSIQQLNHIVGSSPNSTIGSAGILNQGSPTQRATRSTNHWGWHTSTNTQPYDFNVKRGDIIPTILNNH